jgi:hypothetical protein
MYLMRVLNVLLVTAAVALFAVGARADSIPVASYDINGSMTIAGNATSTETIDFAFTLDYFALGSYLGGPVYGYSSSIVSPILVAASGPLGLFGSNSAGFGAGGGPGQFSGYLPFFNAGGDEIDLEMNYVDEQPTLGSPTQADSQIYGCRTAACVADFSLISGSPTVSFGPYGTAQFTATAIPTDPPTNTPEPPTILMISLGILGLLGIASMRTFNSKREAAPSR